MRKYERACGGSIETCKKHGPVRELVSPENRKLACSRRLVGAHSDHVRTMLGARAHWHGNAKVSPGLNCVAGAALSKGQVQISWQAQHFRKVKYSFRGRRSTFARSSKDFVAGAAFSPGQVQNSWQVKHFRKIKCRMRDRRSILARSGVDFVAGAALSQGQVKISWHAQHFRKVNFRSRGSKIATLKYESTTRSPLSQLGLENRNF